MDPDALILLRDVAERSSAEREEYYAQHGVAAAVRDQVEALLAGGQRTLDSFAGHVASAAVHALLEQQPTPQPSPSTASLLPPAIGRYQVIRPLGRGGMSEVYLAHDPILQRNIAVKLIAGELDDDVARRRLVREASAAGRLRHPNIVTIFDAGEHDGRPYIAMEHVAGETLRAIIRRRDPLPLGRRLSLVEDACAGLAHAHRNGVVHLDIKPDNLILDESGRLKVLDFGIARVLSSDSLATRHVVGTLRYMSPEQVAGEPIDRRSDVFSLGSSLFELLTYVPAYAGSTKEVIYRIATGPVPRLRDVAPETDPRLDAAVGRAMALDPAERFGDAEEFRTELASLRAELDPSGDRPVETPDPVAVYTQIGPIVETPARVVPLPPSHRTARRWRRPLLASAAVVLAAAGGGLWLNGSSSRVEPPAAVTDTPPDAAEAAPPTAPAPEGPTPPARTESGTEGNDVWRRLATADRAGVLRLLQPQPGNADTSSEERLRYDVLAAVNKSVAQSRATAAATPGAASTDAYRLAEERLGGANRLAAARDPIGALGLLWEASDLYVRSLNDGRTNAPAPAADPAPDTPQQSAASAPPALPSSRTPVQSLPPALLAGARGTAAVERRPPDTSVRAVTDVEGVLEALDRYRSAYQARDISRVTQVYPSLGANEVDQIRQTFETLTAYDVEIRDARVQVKTDAATADALVVRRMTPEVGREQSYEVETTFHLRRTSGGWVITDVTQRP